MGRQRTAADRHPPSTDRVGADRVPSSARDAGYLAAVLTAAMATTAVAQEQGDQAALQRRLDAQDARIQELEKRLGGDESAAATTEQPGGFEAVYDKGYVIRSTDPENDPFMLRINGRIQFRYAGFTAGAETYENLATDKTGTPIVVEDRNDLEIERARLSFSGTWLDPKFNFYINIDADTDDAHVAIFHDFWFNYAFDKAFDLHVGKGQVPGSRDWIAGSTSTHFADRSMATSFFRPDRAVGIWATGEPFEDFHYHVMVSNGVVAADLEPNQLNHSFAYAASVWWDPLADYGKGYADLEQHEELAVRVGSSFTYAPQSGLDGRGTVFAEAQYLRLSDGTRLTDLGVTDFDAFLVAVDAAFKYQGLGVNSEWFYRSVQGIAPMAPLPNGFPYSHSEDYGFYIDAGYMVIEKTLEPVARVSTVQGDLKNSWEYAVGLNWYINGSHNNKLTADIALLDGSPVSNSGPDYRIGDDGYLARVQWQIAF